MVNPEKMAAYYKSAEEEKEKAAGKGKVKTTKVTEEVVEEKKK